jgi:hypothetical protein
MNMQISLILAVVDLMNNNQLNSQEMESVVVKHSPKHSNLLGVHILVLFVIHWKLKK